MKIKLNIVNQNTRSVTLQFVLEEGEVKLNKSEIKKQVDNFIGNRSVYKIRNFGDDKEVCVGIIFEY